MKNNCMNKKCHKIMFVCLGNICRSPMAEFIMKDLIKREHADADCDFIIASAATSDEVAGYPVYPPAQRELAAHGIDCAGKRAVQLTYGDYGRYDMFLCMDNQNLLDTQRIFNGDPDGKACLLLSLTEKSGEIADPWYSGDFAAAYSQILRGCKALLAELAGGKN